MIFPLYINTDIIHLFVQLFQKKYYFFEKIENRIKNGINNALNYHIMTIIFVVCVVGFIIIRKLALEKYLNILKQIERINTKENVERKKWKEYYQNISFVFPPCLSF